uniref:Lipase n=1 Tax=Rhabditophanes sp. KR3021 TaxID=114890 RepID=A0AC35UH09_9BILA
MIFNILTIVLFLSSVCYGQDRLAGPFTQDFQSWLTSNGYGQYNFPNLDMGKYASYGGKASNDKLKNTPVVFIHGNSDGALNTYAPANGGWTSTITHFLSKGYSTSELYAVTWGDRDALTAALKVHDCKTVTRLRKFVEAVLAYTGAPKISVITHSMGVTLGRKAIKGGILYENSISSCDLGNSLGSSVDVFIGISGANYGLCNCQGVFADEAATCNQVSGLWPGDFCGFNFACGIDLGCTSETYSSFLTQLNRDTQPEGTTVYSQWSTSDEVIQYSTKVWGQHTCQIPNSITNVLSGLTHEKTKDDTAETQYQMITHTFQ